MLLIELDPLFSSILRHLGIALDVSFQDRPVQASIPPEMFRKLLFLCHPDKHNNHPHAQEVTQWLLEERKKQSKPS